MMNDYRLAHLRRAELIADARRCRTGTEPRWVRWARRRLAALRTPALPAVRRGLRIVR